jgi:two-component system nitrogen regulation response regulator GlnG
VLTRQRRHPAPVGGAATSTCATQHRHGRDTAPAPTPTREEWHTLLRQWAELKLRAGQDDLLGEALPEFERTLIRIALAECGGQRQEAARRLGGGRNTRTRQIKELGLGDV